MRKLAEKHAIIGDVRGGHGLMTGIEIVSDREHKTPMDMDRMKRIHQATYEAGAMVRLGMHNILMSPPLTITEAEVDTILDALDVDPDEEGEQCTLRAALEIARDESIVGGQYIVVGDGGFTITQAESGTPNLCEIERVGERFNVEQRTYPTTENGLGSLFIPCTGDGEYYLSSGTIRTFEMSASELARFLELEAVPVRIDGTLRWSDRLALEDVYGPG